MNKRDENWSGWVIRCCGFLEFDEDASDPAEAVGKVKVLAEVGVGSTGIGLGEQQELGQAGGGELETNLGQSGRVFSGKVKESVLLGSDDGDAFLGLEPVLVTTAKPIGNVSGGKASAEFLE